MQNREAPETTGRIAEKLRNDEEFRLDFSLHGSAEAVFPLEREFSRIPGAETG